MKLDLRPEYRSLLEKILAVHLPGKIIWVYGSRIKGKSHEGSDLDLLIKSCITADELSNVRQALSDSNLPILVDILDWDSIPDSFKKEIEKEHFVLQYGK